MQKLITTRIVLQITIQHLDYYITFLKKLIDIKSCVSMLKKNM